MSGARNVMERVLEGTGVQLDGPNPWDPQVHDDRFFQRVLRQGTLGLGESYMDGWWDCVALDEMVHRILRVDANDRLGLTWPVVVAGATMLVRNVQSRARAFIVGERHYDIGNDLYAAMLDRRLTYSCGYWREAASLDAAQEAKLDLICRKLGLRSGQRVLDIGCGWGSFLGYAAEKYGVSGVGVTVSKEQAEYARQRYANFPIEIRLEDYRSLRGTFDHVVSVGMFEHVGEKNYRTFFEVVRRVLDPDGLFILHTIGSKRTARTFDPWMEKYIFPNSILPSAAQITAAAETPFVLEDWHNFGADYDTTLLAWWEKFDGAWATLRGTYDDRFYRMWRYYLLACAGSFRSRHNQLWQLVLSPRGVHGGYRSIR